ncbi:MAG: DUF1566 domain-containing protein [Nitrospirae bacterium]|nr:DUF1566 domain-containing protein [Nitrospirota bacterium]
MKTNRWLFFSSLSVMLTLLSLSLLCSSSVTYAGSVSLPQTGQTTSYYWGDDGAVRAGVAWPIPRFWDYGSVPHCMKDNLTGLVWPKYGDLAGEGMSWSDALKYVDKMNRGEVNNFGYTDWRLPNINELESLINAGEISTASWLKDQGFMDVQLGHYWSSTTYFNDTSEAWSVDILLSNVEPGRKSFPSYGVWPVREGDSGDALIWATGQYTSYAAGDDGALHRGVAWPEPRFTENVNNTVTDNLTGLSWTKDASTPNVYVKINETEILSCEGPPANWEKALDYVKCINSARYLGHNDWRLPNRKELMSLIDRHEAYPALPFGHPFIHLKQGYATSTTNARTPGNVWVMYLFSGLIDDYTKSVGFFVWPVRTREVGNEGDIYTLKVSKQGTGRGYITSSDGKIGCGGACTASYTSPVILKLTAAASTNSTFHGWGSDDCVGSDPTCILTMSGDKGLKATFILNPYAKKVKYDFDGDGNSDVLWRSSSTGDVYMWSMNGTKIIESDFVVRDLPLDWDIKATGDFDADGKSDILWQNTKNGDVAIWLMEGRTIKNSGYANRGMPAEWIYQQTGDFNGDGKSDIVWRNKNTGDVYVWYVDGTNISGGGHLAKGMPSEWLLKGTGDFNGDGKSDVLWQNSTNGDVVVWLIKAVEDFDGDGKSDILWQNISSGDVVTWFMNGGNTAGGGYVVKEVPNNWQISTTGYYSSDGKTDILWQNITNGDVYMYIMDGLKVTEGGFVANNIPNDWKVK